MLKIIYEPKYNESKKINVLLTIFVNKFDKWRYSEIFCKQICLKSAAENKMLNNLSKVKVSQGFTMWNLCS